MNPQTDLKLAADFPRFVVTQIADQIKQADTKAFGVMGVLGAITIALLARLNALKEISTVYDPVWVFLFLASAAFIGLSLLAVMKVVYPRLGRGVGGFGGEFHDTMTFFRSVVKMSEEEYVKKGLALSNQDIIEESYHNAHDLAAIADKKYHALRIAMAQTGLALLWTLGVLVFS